MDQQEGNTSEVGQEGLTPQTEDTQAQANQEPAPKVEEEKIFGKYKDLSAAQKAYKSIQAEATKAKQELKQLKEQLSSKQIDEIKNSSYEDQMNYLLTKIKEQDEFVETLKSTVEEQSLEAQIEEDQKAIKKFIKQNPILKETGLDEEFMLIATHPSMQEYKLESIFNEKMKPKLEKLMGTKITVRDRPLSGLSGKAQINKTIDEMSLDEYEANRAEILKGLN